MLSYAFKRGCHEIILVYPNLSDDTADSDNFEIISGFIGHAKVTIKAMEIPFFSITDFIGIEAKLMDTLQKCLNNY